MSAPIMSPSYVDADYIREANDFGGGMEFSPAATRIGFIDPRDAGQMTSFLEHRNPLTGLRAGRWQKNSPEWVYCVIFSGTASVNAWAKSLTAEEFSSFVSDDFKPAVKLGLSALEQRCFVRAKRDGVALSEKAELVGLTAVHSLARDGNLSIHAHAKFWRWGLTERGEVKSFADRRFVVRGIQAASEVFHASLAASLEARWGQKVELVKGRAELVGLPKELLETVGTRRKAMKAYLAEQGIKPTGPALAFAAKNTRQREKTPYTFSERLKSWNSEAGKVALLPGTGVSPQPSPVATRLKALVDEFVIQPARVIGVAYRRTWGKPPGAVKVRDVEAFLFDTRRKSRSEGHKAAIRALFRTNLKGLDHALRVAEAGYKQGRTPHLILPPRTRVVVSRQAAAEMSPAMREELTARAMKEGWVLRIGGQELREGQALGR